MRQYLNNSMDPTKLRPEVNGFSGFLDVFLIIEISLFLLDIMINLKSKGKRIIENL